MPALSKRKRYLKAASNAAASKRRREAEELSRHLLPSHLSPPLMIQTQIYVVQIQSQNLVIRNWNNETTGKTRIALTTHYLNHDQMLSQLKYKEGADSRLRGLYAK